MVWRFAVLRDASVLGDEETAKLRLEGDIMRGGGQLAGCGGTASAGAVRQLRAAQNAQWQAAAPCHPGRAKGVTGDLTTIDDPNALQQIRI